jgi:tyrosyl-tRNA synthetase
MTLSEELIWRGFVNQTTFKDIKVLDDKHITFYWGVDPSADSMHIGQLAMTMMIRRFIKAGHKPILLVGGATGLIGDPDGKVKERDLKSEEEVVANKKGIAAQYKQLFDGYEVMLVDNYDWFKNIGYLQFLRDVGKHVPMRQMLGREFVESRLHEDGAGISYAEFSYSLIQGYDFVHLYREFGTTLQVCGADQWGNSIAGVELIRRIEGAEAHIWSAPLIINKTTGKKFGKSEDGAVWLDADKTSPYAFYQFWINVDDQGVEDYLKIYTELDKDAVDDIMNAHKEASSNRFAQKRLAYEVTNIVHGKKVADAVTKATVILFGGGDYADLTIEDFDVLKSELRYAEGHEQSIVELLVVNDLAKSKSEARQFLESNAIYINGQQIPLNKTTIEASDTIHGYVIIRRGKNQQMLYKLIHS